MAPPPYAAADTAPVWYTEVRFLGGWLEGMGRQHLDTKKRLASAQTVWNKLAKQLESLLYGVDCRFVSVRQCRKFQAFQNKVVRGATRTRLSAMHEAKETMADLRQRLRTNDIATEVRLRQLRWVGHVMRLPPQPLDRKMFFSVLLPEITAPAPARRREQDGADKSGFGFRRP